MSAARLVARQYLLEVAEVFRYPQFQKILGTALRLRTLVLVIEAAGDRVVGVVRLVDEIGDRQLQLMGPEPPGLARRHELVTRSEVKEDVGGLANQKPPRSEIGRGEGRMFSLLAVEQAHHGTLPARFSGDIDLIGSGLLQRQAYEL